jgi:hypothetical protein
MAVDDSKTIDFVSVNGDSGIALLVISDHLDWIDTVDHQLKLQSKLNAYLVFVESGELVERFPDATGKPVEMRVVFLCQPDAEGGQFLARAKETIERAGFAFSYQVGLKGIATSIT